MKKLFSLKFIIIAFLSVIFFNFGCSRYRYIYLRYDLYIPNSVGISEKYSEMSIVLDDIYNNAEDTTIHGYYSYDRSIFYDTSLMTSYYWYSLQKILTACGIKVYTNEQADNEIPKLQIILRSINDTTFQFTAQLQIKKKQPFIKNYIIKQEPPSYKNMSDMQIEHISYEMITKMAVAILEDPEFKSAFFQ